MAKTKLDSVNWDKAGTRLWLVYQFWKPADFAANHGIAERTVRHLMSLGMPFHGKPHRGLGGVRLGRSAASWARCYRILTANGALRFSGMHPDFLDELQAHVDDEKFAFAKLYGGAWPAAVDAELDEYLTASEAKRERQSWKTGFREVTRRA